MSTLKSVGVFWDIENCCVPKGKSALKIIERIRECFFQDYREAEFICVCDINKESDSTVKDLNDGQINVVHINATAKNAADDKIRQSLRRFSDSHPPGTKVVLISSDVNFASDLSDLRHRKKFEVVLVHKAQVSAALLSCATEHYLYESLIKDLPDRPGQKEAKENALLVSGYSKEMPQEKVKQILKMLSNNCGGKVLSIGPLFAVLLFDTPELLERARKRMNGEDVYGRKITVCLPEESAYYNTVRKLTATHLARRNESPSPQRRPARDRATPNRSYTPDSYDRNSRCDNYPSFTGHGFFNQFLAADCKAPGPETSHNKSNVDHYMFKPPAVERYEYTPYNKAPGAPLGNQQKGTSSSMAGGTGNSPSHTHTLPNSNSEKYYHTKSTPSSLDNLPYNAGSNSTSGTHFTPSSSERSTNSLTSLLGGKYVMDDLSSASKGRTVTVFKANGRSLADIPIPSFGFRDIPPPSIPSANSGNSRLDPNAASFDPIKLVETASKDISALVSSSQRSQAPQQHQPPPSQGFTSQFSGQKSYSGRRYPSPNSRQIGGNNLNPSQGSAFTRHQPLSSQNIPHQPYSQLQGHQQYGHQHQSRSLSVPLQHGPENTETNVTEDEICMMHGYPPSNASRSHSQGNSAFKKPASPHKNFKNQYTYGYNRHPSPNRGRHNSRESRNSFSSDGEDRPYSPVTNTSSSGKQGFRPRLASAPSGPPPNPPSRTPSPFCNPPPVRPRSRQYGSNLYRVPTPDSIGEPSTDYQHPDFNASTDQFVELVVSNLDYNIHPREWRKIIYATFHPHVKILSIQVRLQADNTSVATVRLPSEQDARFAIAQFHRRKIGYKRINVQFKSDVTQSPADSLRTDTIALLMEAKDNKMALSRLIDLFDKRFHKTVSVSDIYKMRDTIHILENAGAGRCVKLQPGIRRSPTPTQALEGEIPEVLEQPVCPIHCAEGSVYYTEALNACMLPNVLMLRKHFAPQLHSLLLSHNGYIPLMSFPACYAAEFKPINPLKENGIPLEHVISCVPGVEIMVSKVGVKVIQFQENREPFYDMLKGNSWQELGKISREVMELLRQQPSCSMPVSKFIPAYHHYFGRQCRVADYGYTKLQELFEGIPHAIQILGTGDRKAITLSPRAQLKRFTTDILKVVKSQPAKQIMLDDFPPAFEKSMGRPLCLPHYGICYMEDILMDIPTTTLIVIEESSHVLLALPRRDQTPEEVERTKQFALEVVDLLKHNPQCRMPFNKFIPAYHHHFGRQCRVADYGFNKLTDLFEAIAHVVELEEEGEERFIHLSLAELRKVLCEQLTVLLKQVGRIPVNKILMEYAKHFGFTLKLEDFGAESTKALLLKLKNHVKLEKFSDQEYASLVKEFHIPHLGLQVMQLLMDQSGGSLPLMELCIRYESMFGVPCDVDRIREDLSDYVQIDEEEYDNGGVIRLTSQQMLGRNLRLLLLHRDSITMSDLSASYKQQYGVELSPALYGFGSLFQLLHSFPHILEVKGKPTQKYVVLSGMLATPGILPPARVDVTSPNQFTSNSSSPSVIYESSSSRSTNSSERSLHQSPQSSTAPSSELLRHASQLWDSGMASLPMSRGQSDTTNSSTDPNAQPMTSTRIMDLLNGNMGSVSIYKRESPSKTKEGNSLAPKDSPSKIKEAISPNGVPVAWQMKAGGERVVSGNIGRETAEMVNSPIKNPPTSSVESELKLGDSAILGISSMVTESVPAYGYSSQNYYGQAALPKVSERNSANAELREVLGLKKSTSANDVEEGIFALTNPPLETSSTTSSQPNSSSQSSIASPVKRKTRIAANFNSS